MNPILTKSLQCSIGTTTPDSRILERHCLLLPRGSDKLFSVLDLYVRVQQEKRNKLQDRKPWVNYKPEKTKIVYTQVETMGRGAL